LSYYLKFRIESNGIVIFSAKIAYRMNHICILRTNVHEMAPY